MSDLDANNFFALTDKFVLAGAAAKEELDSHSTTDEFIEAIAQSSADFIRNNRNAFDLDDAAAVKEFSEVLLVDKVLTRIIDLLTQPAKKDEKIKEEEVVSSAQQLPAAGDSEEFVSEDVMKILDE